MDISFYNAEGRITGTASGDQMSIQGTIERTTKLFVEGSHFGKPVYVVDGVVTNRPANPAVLTGATLSNLPVPCDIRVNQTVYKCTEDHAELTFDQPGTYTILVSAWPYLDGEFTHVNPA